MTFAAQPYIPKLPLALHKERALILGNFGSPSYRQQLKLVKGGRLAVVVSGLEFGPQDS
jgi:hypothetical protein